jgi:hypothetical protein
LLIVEYNSGLLQATPNVLKGDYNRDGTVDAADYVTWRDQLGTEVSNLVSDGNRNGMIDQGDYDVWKANFGLSAGSGAVSNGSLPEPATLSLLLLTATAWCLGYRNYWRSSIRITRSTLTFSNTST